MGGCCCSSRKSQLQGAPLYYYCQPPLEERVAFRSCSRSAPGLPAGLLAGLNLDASTPDTYRAPPAPIPFNVLFGRPQSPLDTLVSKAAKRDAAEESGESKLISISTTVDSFGNSVLQGNAIKSNRKTLADILFASPTNSETENSKSNEKNALMIEEEDCCPICLEVYDTENPKMVTNCDHEFHLSCLLEWMERSHSCPVCDKCHISLPKSSSSSSSIVSCLYKYRR